MTKTENSSYQQWLLHT